MKNAILEELAKRWIQDARVPDNQDGSPEAQIQNAKDQGYRECKRECADGLRMLISILPD